MIELESASRGSRRFDSHSSDISTVILRKHLLYQRRQSPSFPFVPVPFFPFPHYRFPPSLPPLFLSLPFPFLSASHHRFPSLLILIFPISLPLPSHVHVSSTRDLNIRIFALHRYRERHILVLSESQSAIRLPSWRDPPLLRTTLPRSIYLLIGYQNITKALLTFVSLIRRTNSKHLKHNRT